MGSEESWFGGLGGLDGWLGGPSMPFAGDNVAAGIGQAGGAFIVSRVGVNRSGNWFCLLLQRYKGVGWSYKYNIYNRLH